MMPQDESNKILDPCPNCATLIDVSECEPFSEIHCPICGSRNRVRRQFNHFALQQVLGEGGMGTVFEALDVNLMRPLAVKILKKEYSADEENIAKLETEARITASINHPHVVKVFSAGQDHGQFYLAMEMVSKGTLDQLMDLQGRVAEVQVLDVGMQIADGLNAALQTGLIHRDIKPGNILFSDAHTAKIVDFGLALLMEDEAKSRGEIWGTPYYVAPEKLNNEPEDFRSDIYSLGGTLFHAISGRPPFEAASASLVALKHLKSQAVSLQAFAPDVSNETAYVINRMLHKDPLQRYQSYEELIEHLNYAKSKLLERSADGNQPKVRAIVETEETKTFTGWLTLALIAIMLGGGVYVWLHRTTIFGAATADAPAATQRQDASAAVDQVALLAEGRQFFADGNVSEAIDSFDKIINATETSQPLKNWALSNKGLALLHSGQMDDGREIFTGLQSAGMYSTDAGDSGLANFFVELGRLTSGRAVVPGTAASIYSNANFEAFGLLTFAVKDWQQSKFEDAAPLLEKFNSGDLQDDYSWIGDYKAIASKYLADYQIYAALKPKVDAANTPALRADALREITDARSKLVLSGTLPETLTIWEAQLKKTAAASEQETQQTEAAAATELVEKEKASWAECQVLIKRAEAEFSPASAIAELNRRTFSNPELTKARTNALQKLTWLENFKSELVKILATGVYHDVVVNRKGAVLKGGVATADQIQLKVASPYGAIPVPWKEVQPDNVVSIAEKELPGSGENPAAARKKWLIGVFQMASGTPAKGRNLLLEAAQIDPAWNDQLPVYFAAAY